MTSETLIHRAVHHFNFIGDEGYFSETGETAALSMAQFYTNADSYACNAYLLSYESAATLRPSRNDQEKEGRGQIPRNPSTGGDFHSSRL